MVPPRLIASLPDRYAFERELGQGGMATVYLADDLKHHRKVAIKLLRPELTATVGPERFLREIRIAAQLQHPHILPLLESGEADGFLYYVMPYVDGESLRERLVRQGELPVHEAVRLLAQIVDALSYAHARGVVHRDIKPDNVMVSGRHALVMDFGVAKAVSEASGRNQLTTAGVALGTPAYMAPEQAAADPHFDHRVDIYAVGAMAYELLAGRPPFVGGTPQQVLAAHVTQPVDPLSRHRPGIPVALESVIMRCLAKRPADRWQTAEELLAQLEPLATPSGGMTPTTTRPISGWKGEHPSRKWIGAAAGVLIGVAALAWALKPRERRPSLMQLDRAQVTFTGNVRAPSLSADGTRIAFAQRKCDSAGICTFDVVVQDVGGAGAATVVRDAINVWHTDWTRDGRYLLLGATYADGWGYYAVPVLGGPPRLLGQGFGSLVGNGDTTLVEWALPGDTLAWIRRVATASGTVYDSVSVRIRGDAFPAVKPTGDGRWLVLMTWRGRGASIAVADRRGQLRDSVVFPVRGFNDFASLPGSSDIIALADVGGGSDAVYIVRYRISDAGKISRPDTLVRDIDIDAMSINGAGQLVVASGPAEFSVSSFEWDGRTTRTMATRRLARTTSIQVTGSISNDGRRVLLLRDVAVAGGLRQFGLIPFDSGPERPVGNPMPIVDWDWGGREIHVAVARSDSVVIGTVDELSGRIRERRAFAGQEYEAVEGVPTGGFIVTAPGGRRLHAVGVPEVPDTVVAIAPEHGQIEFAEPSPDGREVALAGFLPGEDSLAVHILSLANGTVRRLATFNGENIDAVRWLPGGSLLVPVGETGWTRALYEVPVRGGVPRRLGLLPVTQGTIRFSADGRRGIIRSLDANTDIHVIRNFRELTGR